MADKKIAETPDFVKGLLKSADEIRKLLNPKISMRVLLEELGKHEKKLEDFSSEERQELGVYQARVVLMVLAVELALKYLWEQDKRKASKPNHKINELFNTLCPSLQDQIQSEYCKLAGSPPIGWETPTKIFELCEGASVQWRYLVEEHNFPKYVMQAKYLKYATLSVLQVSEKLPQRSEE